MILGGVIIVALAVLALAFKAIWPVDRTTVV